jgi:biopolymer transport protein ExbB
MTLGEIFDLGGPLMWAILACSIVGVMALAERIVALWPERILPGSFYRKLIKHLEAKDMVEVARLCRSNQSLLARIVDAGLKTRSQGRARMKEAMEEAGQIAVGSLERWVGVLSAVAAVSPLLGLLGTVQGMIGVFQEVADQVNPSVSQLAGGIWMALLTTAYGLVVAIPFYLAYRFIDGWIGRSSHRLEEAALEIGDRLADLGEDPKEPSA